LKSTTILFFLFLILMAFMPKREGHSKEEGLGWERENAENLSVEEKLIIEKVEADI